MEPKKDNRYTSGRSRLTVPERGDESVHASHSSSKPAASKKHRSLLYKRSALRVRDFILAHKIIALILVLVITGVITGAIISYSSSAPSSSVAKNTVSDPGYQTVLPNGKTILELGGWERISPPASDPVYAYSDKIGTIPISVSEQPIPNTFEGDVDAHVADLAKKFNATNKITAGDTTIYIGTSAKGPQSVIFIKINLLILVKSQGKISDDSWIKYIKSLNVSNKAPAVPAASSTY